MVNKVLSLVLGGGGDRPSLDPPLIWLPICKLLFVVIVTPNFLTKQAQSIQWTQGLFMPFWNCHFSCNIKYSVFILYTIGVPGRGRGGCRAPPWKISGQILFSGQAQVAQNFWNIKTSKQWKFSGQFCFSVQVVQKCWRVKKFSMQCIQCIFTWGWSV